MSAWPWSLLWLWLFNPGGGLLESEYKASEADFVCWFGCRDGCFCFLVVIWFCETKDILRHRMWLACCWCLSNDVDIIKTELCHFISLHLCRENLTSCNVNLWKKVGFKSRCETLTAKSSPLNQPFNFDHRVTETLRVTSSWVPGATGENPRRWCGFSDPPKKTKFTGFSFVRKHMSKDEKDLVYGSGETEKVVGLVRLFFLRFDDSCFLRSGGRTKIQIVGDGVPNKTYTLGCHAFLSWTFQRRYHLVIVMMNCGHHYWEVGGHPNPNVYTLNRKRR